jgi:hypothetical protein
MVGEQNSGELKEKGLQQFFRYPFYRHQRQGLEGGYK